MRIEPLQTSPEKGYGIGSIETPPWPVAFVQQPFVNADAQIAQKAHTETNPCSSPCVLQKTHLEQVWAAKSQCEVSKSKYVRDCQGKLQTSSE